MYLVSLQYSVVIVGGMSGGAIALSIALMHGTRITVRSTTIINDIVITGHATALVGWPDR